MPDSRSAARTETSVTSQGVLLSSVSAREDVSFFFIIMGSGIVGMSNTIQLMQPDPDRRMLLVEHEDGPGPT